MHLACHKWPCRFKALITRARAAFELRAPRCVSEAPAEAHSIWAYQLPEKSKSRSLFKEAAPLQVLRYLGKTSLHVFRYRGTRRAVPGCEQRFKVTTTQTPALPCSQNSKRRHIEHSVEKRPYRQLCMSRTTVQCQGQ